MYIPYWKFAKITIYDLDHVDEMEEWCKNNFGYESKRWYCIHNPLSVTFKFKEKEDAVFFIMTWTNT